LIASLPVTSKTNSQAATDRPKQGISQQHPSPPAINTPQETKANCCSQGQSQGKGDQFSAPWDNPTDRAGNDATPYGCQQSGRGLCN
jgi:hypothetical protein